MTDPIRTPYCRKIRYGVTGAPILTGDEMDGSHAPGVGIAPTLIELAYITARDGKPASISAAVTGNWTRFGQRDPDGFGGTMTTHFKNGLAGWPQWLADEARLHDPTTARTAAADPVQAVIAALQERAGELSELAEEEMRPSLEERAQEWHQAVEVVRRAAKAAR